MADRIQLPRTPAVMAWVDEARAMEVGLPMLLTADLGRLRRMLASAQPDLTDWEWNLVSHVMHDEAIELLTDRDNGERIMPASWLSAEIQDWADGASGDELLRAEALAKRALGWSDLERWALMVRRRAEIVAESA